MKKRLVSSRCSSMVNDLTPEIKILTMNAHSVTSSDAQTIKQGLQSLSLSPQDSGKKKQLSVALLNQVNLYAIICSLTEQGEPVRN